MHKCIVSKNIRHNPILRDPDYISSMPKASKFPEIEEGEILALKVERMSYWKITGKTHGSKTPEDNFLKDPDGYN
ncbi:Hypothetical predicted protein [Octopus vulgaris]|uniref:Uncharacterized protein n=1 Tax=Octopus vulgaris TaxID=6645 RepID=A0AA36F979_OCTVU|nr:Hypothetical predicted protein [Octopus vulgaris]